jgi:hypothetical protein
MWYRRFEPAELIACDGVERRVAVQRCVTSHGVDHTGKVVDLPGDRSEPQLIGCRVDAIDPVTGGASVL